MESVGYVTQGSYTCNGAPGCEGERFGGCLYCDDPDYRHEVDRKQIDWLRGEIERLRDSIGAIHYHAQRKRFDLLPILAAIVRECEHAVPELVTTLWREGSP